MVVTHGVGTSSDPLPAGVLAAPPPGCWSLHRRDPEPELAPFVAWFWAVEWDLRGQRPHRQSTLPHPSAHLVVEGGRAVIHGPTSERFTRTLSGAGRVVAVRFQPAGLRPYLDQPMTSLLDGTRPAGDLLDVGFDAAATAAVGEHGDDVEAAMAALANIVGRPAGGVDVGVTTTVNAIVEVIAADRSINDLGALVSATGHHPRTLQRLMADHVGLGPKAVIRRCRLQEAAAVALAGADVDWAATAARLGYYDQAHLTREFTRIIGTPPATYAQTHAR